MKNIKNIFNKVMLSESGSSLTETLLAIALVAAMAPYAYYRIADTSRAISDVTFANRVANWTDKMDGYMRVNAGAWPDGAVVDLDENEFYVVGGIDPNNGFPDAVHPYVAFIEKYKTLSGTNLDAYMAFDGAKRSAVDIAGLAKMLGDNAAIVGADKNAFSPTGAWTIESPTFKENDLVYRASITLATDDTDTYLHRAGASGDLNTMGRDLGMAGHAIINADTINAAQLSTPSATAWFASADAANFDNATFPDSATMDADKGTIGALSVSGDIMGFRNIDATKLVGANNGALGAVITDRANVDDSIEITRDLNVKSLLANTISGFSEITAWSMVVSFVSATDIRFAGGFGINVSNELSSSMPPLQIGSWSFPGDGAPKFDSLTLANSGDIATFATPDVMPFAAIMSDGWQEAEQVAGQIVDSR